MITPVPMRPGRAGDDTGGGAGRATGYAGAMMARTGAYRAWRRARRTAAGGPPHA
ncbi:hypothetical protein [Komagataeibacter rhaeticus]|uniref:hypothetical protein n=1 Tax=Komagataeibacter rhaeticus TaxID=215221 RepID=UPI001CD31C1D|nr:hypothetical protein [Komagataeibacter rhaeticus]